MYKTFESLLGRKISAKDGEIGKVVDILFDDKRWKIRYFVVDTSFWLPLSKVLVSPASISLDSTANDDVIHSYLTKKQIENSPPLEDDLPVNRQYEEKLNHFFGWTQWWGSPSLISGPYRDIAAANTIEWRKYINRRDENFDENLRSANEIIGYKMKTLDNEEFGSIDGFIVDLEDWSIADIIMNNRSWVPFGTNFTCSPLYVTEIDFEKDIIAVSLTKATLLDSPELDLDNYNFEYRKKLMEIHSRDFPFHNLNIEHDNSLHV